MLSIPVTYSYSATCKPTGSKHRTRAAPDPPPLFDDTSGGYPLQPGGYPAPGADVAFNVNHLLGDPVANVAMAYGSSIASHGKDIVHKEVWCPPGRGWQDSWPRRGLREPHLLPTASLRAGALCPQPPLSSLPAAPLCVCQQTQVFFRCGHSLCGQEARATGLPLHAPGEPAAPRLILLRTLAPTSPFSPPLSVPSAAAATARTGRCSTVVMSLCPRDKTSTPLTSIFPVSLARAGGVRGHQRGESRV